MHQTAEALETLRLELGPWAGRTRQVPVKIQTLAR